MVHGPFGFWALGYLLYSDTPSASVRYEVLANQHLGGRMVQPKKAQNTSFLEGNEGNPAISIHF